MAKVCLVVLVTSKNSRVTRFGCQLISKNLIINAKILCAPFDIYMSNLWLQNHILPRLAKQIIVWFFSINSSNISCESYLLESKWILGHKCILKCINLTFFINCKDKLFFIIRNPKPSKNYFCSTSSFLKGSFSTKTLKI